MLCMWWCHPSGGGCVSAGYAVLKSFVRFQHSVTIVTCSFVRINILQSKFNKKLWRQRQFDFLLSRWPLKGNNICAIATKLIFPEIESRPPRWEAFDQSRELWYGLTQYVCRWHCLPVQVSLLRWGKLAVEGMSWTPVLSPSCPSLMWLSHVMNRWGTSTDPSSLDTLETS